MGSTVDGYVHRSKLHHVQNKYWPVFGVQRGFAFASCPFVPEDTPMAVARYFMVIELSTIWGTNCGVGPASAFPPFRP
jgi:hypothetical protein